MAFTFNSGNFDIQLPSNDESTIKLGSKTHASIINGTGSVTLDKADDDQTKVNINTIHPKSEMFSLTPNVDVTINEVDLNGIKKFTVEGKESSKVEIKSLKVQQKSEAEIENVELTGNVKFGLGSSLKINKLVKLEQSTLDFPFDTAQMSDSKAPLNGLINGKPRKIIVSNRKIDEYLDDDQRILLVQSSEDFGCNEWGSIESQISGKSFEKECVNDKSDFRLYAKEMHDNDGGNGDGDNGKDDNKLGLGPIAGIVIAAVVVVGVIVFLLVFFLVIKKRKNNNNSSNKEASEKEDNADEV